MSINITRYIKNNTGSTIYYLGVPITAGSYFLIPVEKYMAYANLTSLITDIYSGDVSISKDGVTTLSDLNEQINHLKGFDTEFSFNGDKLEVEASVVSNNSGIPPNNNPVIIVDDPDININNKNQSHSNVYSYTGSGKLYNFSCEFSNDNVFIRLVIDGTEVFDVDCDILDNMISYSNTSNALGWTTYDRENDIFHFSPREPFSFSSSVSIESRSNSSSNSRYLARYKVELTKET